MTREELAKGIEDLDVSNELEPLPKEHYLMEAGEYLVMPKEDIPDEVMGVILKLIRESNFPDGDMNEI